MFKRLRSLFQAAAARHDFEDGMTEELRFHIEQYTDDLKRSGMEPNEALRRARMELGGLNSVKEECREARGLRLVDEARRQVGYGARLLRKSPGFTVAALLTLAVCIGANLTIFAVMDSVLLQPLPFPDADRLVTMYNTYPKAGVLRDGSSITNYYERRGNIPAFSALSVYRFGTALIGEPGATERVQITRVSPDFFATLGKGPRMGRVFNETETTYQTDSVAILTDAYWRQHLNADPMVIGRQIRVDGVAKTVVGVLPADFRFLSSESALYFPFSSNLEQRAPLQRHSGGNVNQIIARLRPDTTVAQAQSQIDAQNGRLEVDDPQGKMMADAGFRSLVVPLHGDHVASIRPTLILLQAGALALLLIGVVNLMNLLLVRASGRAKELALRRALGASGGHVVSEVVVETSILTTIGGILGLAVAAGGIRLLARLGADQLPLGSQIAFDARLAVVAWIGAIVLGVVLAAPIVLANFRGPLLSALQSENRGGTISRGLQRLRHSFIVAQIALAFVLLSGTGLVGLSLKRAMEVSPGFRSDHILTGQISLPFKSYSSGTAALSFTERLTGEMSRQPGMVAFGVVNNLPFSGKTGKSAAYVVGHVLRAGESARGNYSYGVGGDYFNALGFVLKAGRFLTAADSRRTERVCVVDEDFARYYWPNRSALGQQLFQGSEPGKANEAFTVVGVVGSVKQAGLTEDEAQGAVYYPFAFRPDNEMFLVARTTVTPENFGLTMQRLVRQMDEDLPVNDLRSMETRISDSLVTRRSPAVVAGLFSAIAVLLTALGTYGVLSYAVAQRRREIGVRMALGARPQQIRGQFFGLTLQLLAGGMLLGMGGAWLVGEGVQTVLFHVSAIHWPTWAATAAVMGIVSLLACLIPAERAVRVSPMEALGDR